MGYCNKTTDLKIRGTYLKQSVPDTLNLNLDEMVLIPYEKINEELFKVGLKVPILAINIHASNRVKFLNALGANAEIEEAIITSGRPGGVQERTIGKTFRERFEKRLEKYCKYPKSLYTGDDDTVVTTDVYDGHLLIAPAGGALWSHCADHSGDADQKYIFESDGSDY